MCLGELAQVVELGAAASALVRSRQRTATVSLLTLDEAVAPGDWVLCHSGFALARVSAREAAEAAGIRETVAAPATHTARAADTAPVTDTAAAVAAPATAAAPTPFGRKDHP